MSKPKIVSVNSGSLIQVTFSRGLDDPDFVIEQIHFDGFGEKYTAAAFLKACANLFNEKAEKLEAEFEEYAIKGIKQ